MRCPQFFPFLQKILDQRPLYLCTRAHRNLILIRTYKEELSGPNLNLLRFLPPASADFVV